MRSNLNRFLYGLLVVFPSLFLSIAQSLVGILCLGYYVPSWGISLMFTIGRWYHKSSLYASLKEVAIEKNSTDHCGCHGVPNHPVVGVDEDYL